MSARDLIARADYEAHGYAYDGRTENARGDPYGMWKKSYRSADSIIAALTAAGYRILGPEELDPVTIKACAKEARDYDRERRMYDGFESYDGRAVARRLRNLSPRKGMGTNANLWATRAERTIH